MAPRLYKHRFPRNSTGSSKFYPHQFERLKIHRHCEWSLASIRTWWLLGHLKHVLSRYTPEPRQRLTYIFN